MTDERPNEKVEVTLEPNGLRDSLAFNGKKLFLVTGDKIVEDEKITTSGLVLASSRSDAEDAFCREHFSWNRWDVEANPVIVGE